MTPTRRARVLAGLAVCGLLAACRWGQEIPTNNQPEVKAPAIAALAPAAPAQRAGVWLGGPEPISGKLRTGIAVYYRWQTSSMLVLRLEGASAEDATVGLTTSDGARLVPPGQPSSWRLKAGLPSELSVTVAAPAAGGYVHVLTGQNGRHATRSISLNPSAAAVALPSHAAPASDASGAPIVRMQALPTK